MRVDPKMVAELTKVVLKNNIFEFARKHFLQVEGTAMGRAPAYPNIFMGKVDRLCTTITSPYSLPGIVHRQYFPHQEEL